MTNIVDKWEKFIKIDIRENYEEYYRERRIAHPDSFKLSLELWLYTLLLVLIK